LLKSKKGAPLVIGTPGDLVVVLVIQEKEEMMSIKEILDVHPKIQVVVIIQNPVIPEIDLPFVEQVLLLDLQQRQQQIEGKEVEKERSMKEMTDQNLQKEIKRKGKEIQDKKEMTEVIDMKVIEETELTGMKEVVIETEMMVDMRETIVTKRADMKEVVIETEMTADMREVIEIVMKGIETTVDMKEVTETTNIQIKNMFQIHYHYQENLCPHH